MCKCLTVILMVLHQCKICKYLLCSVFHQGFLGLKKIEYPWAIVFVQTETPDSYETNI